MLKSAGILYSSKTVFSASLTRLHTVGSILSRHEGRHDHAAAEDQRLRVSHWARSLVRQRLVVTG